MSASHTSVFIARPGVMPDKNDNTQLTLEFLYLAIERYQLSPGGAAEWVDKVGPLHPCGKSVIDAIKERLACETVLDAPEAFWGAEDRSLRVYLVDFLKHSDELKKGSSSD